MIIHYCYENECFRSSLAQNSSDYSLDSSSAIFINNQVATGGCCAIATVSYGPLISGPKLCFSWNIHRNDDNFIAPYSWKLSDDWGHSLDDLYIPGISPTIYFKSPKDADKFWQSSFVHDSCRMNLFLFYVVFVVIVFPSSLAAQEQEDINVLLNVTSIASDDDSNWLIPYLLWNLLNNKCILLLL